MKEWKEKIVQAVIDKTREQKVVELRDVARANGIKHISAQDTRDILGSIERRIKDYRPVRLMHTPNDSLFQSLAFAENGTDFSDGNEFEAVS